MQGPILIFLLIVVISAVIGAVSQVLKNAAQQPVPQARPRARPAAGGVRPASGDIDRFLEEIDRLRKKKEGGDEPTRSEPPVAKPVARPVRTQTAAQTATAKAVKAEPRRPKRKPETVAEAKPISPPTRLADLPVAPPVVASPTVPPAQYRPVVTAPQQLVAPLRATGAGPKVTVSKPQPPKTEFGRQLAGLLASPRSVPMAVVLAELLGPPKCRQG